MLLHAQLRYSTMCAGANFGNRCWPRYCMRSCTAAQCVLTLILLTAAGHATACAATLQHYVCWH
jgi:hypothetical protein